MTADDLDFALPPDRIAQAPAADRPAARLLHFSRADRSVAHHKFADLPGLLRGGDLLVFNDARVTPARFTLVKPTGGRVEALFVAQTAPDRWTVLLKNLGPVRPDQLLAFENAPGITARVLERTGDTGYTLQLIACAFAADEPVHGTQPPAAAAPVTDGDSMPGSPRLPSPDFPDAPALLARVGRMPLPPYIRRDKSADPRDAFDRDRYQTVYAKAEGSVAAPTAGLHFDDAVLAALTARGVETTFVTLHVGLGTFKPVAAHDLADHTMHVERYALPAVAADAINRAKAEGRRVVAVGTTAARVLESRPPGPLTPGEGETGIFIYPPYAWKHVQALLTNFHLPRSTLIALVAAFVGLDEQRRIYAEAIAAGYRFFSYGDTSFLE